MPLRPGVVWQPPPPADASSAAAADAAAFAVSAHAPTEGEPKTTPAEERKGVAFVSKRGEDLSHLS
jgi:hypothetical protein